MNTPEELRQVAADQARAEAAAATWANWYEQRQGEGVPADVPGHSPEPVAITEAAAISGCNGWDRQ